MIKLLKAKQKPVPFEDPLQTPEEVPVITTQKAPFPIIKLMNYACKSFC